MMRAAHLIVPALAAMLAAGAAGLAAADPPVINVLIKDHRFAPAEIRVPAGQPVVLMVTNADPLAEEFDSTDLKVEKVIAGGQKGQVRLRPLRPGRYAFMGEYHSATAQGVVVVQ
jgi:plastocyanin